jgi:uncharacterized protein (TIGR00369 family)
MPSPMSKTEDRQVVDWQRDEDETFVGAMGEVFVRRIESSIEVALQTGARHKNLSGDVHGGVIMTLLDRVMGINCRNALAGRAATASITVNFLYPVRTGDFLRAKCRLSKVGRSLVFAEAYAYVDDRLVATGSSVCSVRPPAISG